MLSLARGSGHLLVWHTEPGKRQTRAVCAHPTKRGRESVGKKMRICVLLLTGLACRMAAQTQAPASPEPQASSDDTPGFLPDHWFYDRLWLSGQVNLIYQTHPPFPARYSGPNSFQASYEKAISSLTTFYSGLRLNGSTAVLADVEETAGDGLSQTLGLAGFTDLDVVRNPLLSKNPYLARLMVDKVIALSSDKTENDQNPLSLFPELPRRRLELRAGKFSMVDFFDVNGVGSDSHFQFMNWTIDNNGAYDYAADTRGYTWGVMADFEDRTWGFRFAEGLMPKVANGIDMQWNLRRAHAENYEFELRRGLVPGKAGTVRLLGYTNDANMGIYREAIARFLAGQDKVPDITAHPLQTTRKYGFGANLEQTLTPWIKAYGRFGWNNGKTESYAYTEVDQTFSGGVKLEGSKWGRKADRAGLAVVSNGISGDHRRYLALGGQGFLLGDGALNYGREQIAELYYTAHLWRGLYAAPDLQRVVNPGYNRDRGPATVPGLRVHVEF